MAFQSREEYEAWRRRAGSPEEIGIPAEQAEAPAGDDLTLRLSALYGALVLAAGVLFTAIGFLPFG